MNLDTKHTTPYNEHILTFVMSRFHCGVLAVLSLSLTSLFIALYWTLKFFDPDVVFNVLSFNQIISRIFLSNIAHKRKHRCWWLEDGQMVRALASTKRVFSRWTRVQQFVHDCKYPAGPLPSDIQY